jgi:hypothetical protein
VKKKPYKPNYTADSWHELALLQSLKSPYAALDARNAVPTPHFNSLAICSKLRLWFAKTPADRKINKIACCRPTTVLL